MNTFFKFLIGLALLFCGNCSALGQSQLKATCSTTALSFYARQIGGDSWQIKSLAEIKSDKSESNPSLEWIASSNLILVGGQKFSADKALQELAESQSKSVVICSAGESESNSHTRKDSNEKSALSPKQVAGQVTLMAKAISETDATRKSQYQARASLLLYQLQALESWNRQHQVDKSLIEAADEVDRNVFASSLASRGFLSPANETSKRKKIVCSTTQVADFARNIVGDYWEVQCVLQPGQDPHLYKTTIADANLVRSADLCFENGWDLEGNHWMRTLSENAGKPIVSCVDGVKSLVLDKESGQSVKDPHAWMAPANAAIYVKNILNAVCEADPDNANVYRASSALYLYKLQALDNWIKQQVNQIPANRRVLVSHHDAFGYFCKSYGFVAKSPGSWTTEEISGTSLERRLEVARSIRKLGVKAIFIESSLGPRMMQEIAKEAGVKIGGELYSDSMGAQNSAGETYIGMMRENVLTIVTALK